MAEHVLQSPTADAPLLAWLLAALAPMSRTKVKALLQSGRVRVNGKSVTRHDHPLRPGDRVAIARDRPADPTGLPVVYEDDAVIVIDKPAGLLTVATDAEKLDTAFARLTDDLTARRAGRPFVVHRLDRDTSGLLLFARSDSARERLQENWPSVAKTYLAVTDGVPRPPDGVVENYLTEGEDFRVRASRSPGPDAKRAVTRYRVVRQAGPFALVEVGLETGRKHQIRVHMAGLGCPVIGDKTYRAKADPAERLGLHAWKLAFDHPVTGKRIEAESPLPERLKRVVP